MSREEEIRYTLEHEEEYSYYRYEDDVSYLLKRVEDLEKENAYFRNLIREGADEIRNVTERIRRGVKR